MSDIGIQGVLAQIRAIREQAAAPGPPAGPGTQADFGATLTRAVDKVSQAQTDAAQLAEAFERGGRDASLAQVMLAMQQAQLSFKALTEVRNRLVQAYQDIQNMPL